MTDEPAPISSRKMSASRSQPRRSADRQPDPLKPDRIDDLGATDEIEIPGATDDPGPIGDPGETDEVEEPDDYGDEEWAALQPTQPLVPDVPNDEILARAVAALLTGYRRYHRLTQKELAARMDVDQGEVSRLERGQRTPGLRTLARIAAETGSRFTIDVEGPAGGVGAARHESATTFDGVRATVTVLGPTASPRPRRPGHRLRRPHPRPRHALPPRDQPSP